MRSLLVKILVLMLLSTMVVTGCQKKGNETQDETVVVEENLFTESYRPDWWERLDTEELLHSYSFKDDLTEDSSKIKAITGAQKGMVHYAKLYVLALTEQIIRESGSEGKLKERAIQTINKKVMTYNYSQFMKRVETDFLETDSGMVRSYVAISIPKKEIHRVYVDICERNKSVGSKFIASAKYKEMKGSFKIKPATKKKVIKKASFKSIAVALKVQGDAKFVRNGKEQSLKAGSKLADNDVIKTSSNSYVALRYSDKSGSLRVFPNSKVTIKGQASKKGLKKRVNLKSGSLLTRIDKSIKGEYEISTNSSIISVRGTEFYTELLGNGSTQVLGFSGKVEVKNIKSNKTKFVTKGQSALSTKGGELKTFKTKYVSPEIIKYLIEEESKSAFRFDKDVAPEWSKIDTKGVKLMINRFFIADTSTKAESSVEAKCKKEKDSAIFTFADTELEKYRKNSGMSRSDYDNFKSKAIASVKRGKYNISKENIKTLKLGENKYKSYGQYSVSKTEIKRNILVELKNNDVLYSRLRASMLFDELD